MVAYGVEVVHGMVRVCFERWFACWEGWDKDRAFPDAEAFEMFKTAKAAETRSTTSTF